MLIEKDWITEAVVIKYGHRSTGTQIQGMHYDHIGHWFHVHGGMTYSETSKVHPVKSDTELHWIGFDDWSMKIPNKDLDFCIAECESFSKQLKDIDSKLESGVLQ